MDRDVFFEEKRGDVQFYAAWYFIEDMYDFREVADEVLGYAFDFRATYVSSPDNESGAHFDKRVDLEVFISDAMADGCTRKALAQKLWEYDETFFQEAIDKVVQDWWENRA